MEAIIEDDVTSRFEAEELKNWNLLTRTNRRYEFISWRLTVIWMIGFLIRYIVLMPLRVIICFLGVSKTLQWLSGERLTYSSGSSTREIRFYGSFSRLDLSDAFQINNCVVGWTTLSRWLASESSHDHSRPWSISIMKNTSRRVVGFAWRTTRRPLTLAYSPLTALTRWWGLRSFWCLHAKNGGWKYFQCLSLSRAH